MSKRRKAEADHKVGYGHPPLETRFKKGRSGNPSGRPRTTDLTQLLRREANRMVSVRTGDRIVRTTVLKATIRSLFAQAAKGSTQALKLVLPMLQKDAPLPLSPTIILSGMPYDSDNDPLSELAGPHDIVGRYAGKSVPCSENELSKFERIGQKLDHERACGGKPSGRREPET
jgi:hypothetical protein